MPTSVTQRDIQHALRLLNLPDQAVCVHASLRSLGYIAGGAPSVVRAFLHERCTLLVPAFSWSFAVPPPPDQHFPRNGWDYASYPGPTQGLGRIYTPMSADIDKEMGALAAAVVAHPDRVRGDHPLSSFAALGPRAQDLIGAQRSSDVYAPLMALARHCGFVLLIGVGLDKLTLLHSAEQKAGRTLFQRWANAPDGRPIAVTVGGCSAGFPNLESWVHPVTQTITVGESSWKLLSAREALERAIAAIRANPAITHCGDPTCARCNDAVVGGPII
jgi:aminoglycoside N3'-acetyltransferase